VINTVPMDVFTRQESKDFLAKRVTKGLSDKDAGRLAQELGDLPLALEQAGAMLSETGMPIDEYLLLLNEHVTTIMSEGKSPDYPMSMTAAWKMSVQALENQLPQAQELLRGCAFFGPEPIPSDVFRQGARATDSPLGSLIKDPIQLSRAIRELGRFALVTIDGRSVSVHRLIQALLRDGLTLEEQESYRRDVHLIMAAAAPSTPDEVGSWPRYSELLPHVIYDSAEIAKSAEPAVRDLAANMLRYLYQSGDYTTCLTLAERFIDQWTVDSGADSFDVLRAHRHLGNALRLLGRYPDSYSLTERTLAKSSAALGDSHSLTLYLRNSFGADLRARGDFRAARVLDEETRSLLEGQFGPGHPRVLRLLSSLALDHGLNSEYGRAKDLYQDVFPLMMSSVGAATTDVDVLGAWNGIAWSLRLLGDYQAARDVIQDARDFAQDKLGAEHIQTLRSTNGYTIVCRKFPDLREEALEIARSSFALSTRLFGENHPDTLAIAISLANMLRASSDVYHAEALELAEATVHRYPQAYGPEHPYNYGCLGNLALLKRITGDAAEARRLNSDALYGLEKGLTRDHHYTLTVATNLASDLAALGQKDEAVALGQDTRARLTSLLGADHQATLGCAANLALDLMAAGDEEGGQALRADTVALYRASLGDSNPETVGAMAGERLDAEFDPPPI
jgi:tetratricopeptide (TPR) repeat protein